MGHKIPDAGICYDAFCSNSQTPQSLTSPIHPYWGAPPAGDTTNDVGINEAIATIASYARETLRSIENNLALDQVQLADNLAKAQAYHRSLWKVLGSSQRTTWCTLPAKAPTLVAKTRLSRQPWSSASRLSCIKRAIQ